MKKIILFFFITSSLSFSENLDLDLLLNTISENSYEKNIYEIEQNKNKANEKHYKLDKYNGIKANSENAYYENEKVYKTEGSISFGNFYLKGSKKENKDGALLIGVNKNIKDMFYSENDKNLIKNNFDKEIINLNYKKNLISKKLSLIGLYRDYKNLEFEILAKNNGLKVLTEEKEILKKSFSLGQTQEIDLKSLNINKINLEIEIATLKKKKSQIRKKFLYDFNINLKEKNLENIPKNSKNIYKLIKNIGNINLNILNFEKNKIIENIKFLKYKNKYPNLEIGLEHDFQVEETKMKENRVYLKFSKDLFFYDNNLKTENFNLEEKILTIQEQKDKKNSEIIEINNKYQEYEKNYNINKNKADLEKNKYEIKKLEYKLGKIKYLDLMDSFNDYLASQIQSEKAKNNLNAYIYQIIVRGEENENK